MLHMMITSQIKLFQLVSNILFIIVDHDGTFLVIKSLLLYFSLFRGVPSPLVIVDHR